MRVKVIDYSNTFDRIDMRITDQQGHEWTRDVTADELPIRMVLEVEVRMPGRKGEVVTLNMSCPRGVHFVDDEGSGHVHVRMPKLGHVILYRDIEFVEAWGDRAFHVDEV